MCREADRQYELGPSTISKNARSPAWGFDLKEAGQRRWEREGNAGESDVEFRKARVL